jgi:DNA repair protein RadC
MAGTTAPATVAATAPNGRVLPAESGFGDRICDLPGPEQPRERLARQGPAALATAELVAIVVRTGGRGQSALTLARRLLTRFGLVGLASAPLEELCQEVGCGPAKASQLHAAIELGRRLHAAAEAPRRVATPAQAAALLGPEMSLLEQEHLRVVLLSVRHDVLGVHEVYKGSVSGSLVRVAEVFREAVRRNCSAILLAHNHPSGDPSPSADDVRITQRIVEAGRLLDIEVLDHVILARRGWVSLRERGLGFG